jgi:hypothetical protein
VQSYQGDGLDIPSFLRRAKNVPSGLPDDKGNSSTGREPPGQSTVVAPTEPSCRKRWPLTNRDKAVIAELQTARVASDKDKSYDRINKLKQSKADRIALTANKTWDARIARWV